MGFGGERETEEGGKDDAPKMQPLSKEAAEAFAPFLVLPTVEAGEGEVVVKEPLSDEEDLSFTGLRRKKVKKVKVTPIEVFEEGAAILAAAAPVFESATP